MLHFLNWQLITGHALGVVLQVYKALLWYTLIKKERKKKAPRTHLQWETPGVSDHRTWRIGDVVHLPFTKASTTQKLGQCITQSRCVRLVSLGFDLWNSLGLQWQKKRGDVSIILWAMVIIANHGRGRIDNICSGHVTASVIRHVNIRTGLQIHKTVPVCVRLCTKNKICVTVMAIIHFG